MERSWRRRSEAAGRGFEEEGERGFGGNGGSGEEGSLRKKEGSGAITTTRRRRRSKNGHCFCSLERALANPKIPTPEKKIVIKKKMELGDFILFFSFLN